MTVSVPFCLVDVFASAPLTGNPLAVVAEAERLEEPTMRAVAREFNQSETTFVLPPTQVGAMWRLRSFTPAGAEVVGAGHNALRAWWWLATAGRLTLDGGAVRLGQEIGERVLPVEVIGKQGRPSAIAMDQAPPEFGSIVDDPAALAAALGLGAAELSDRVPAQVVSTGAGHLLVAARGRAVVDRARADPAGLAAFLETVGGQGCYLYCLDPVDADAVAYARFFNPTVGTWEDPATGSAAGPLVTQLVAHGVVADGSTVIVEQGHAMGRPSRIEVRVRGEQVRIAGAGVVVAEGTLHVQVAGADADQIRGQPDRRTTQMDATDERHLRRAIELATVARAAGDMPYGALLVGPDDSVLAVDRNTVHADNDITAHPELKLARWAAHHLEADVAHRTTMYTSCQPCGMCAGAINRAGLGRVVFALASEQLEQLKPAGSVGPDAADVAYEGPALFDEARVPIDGYYD